jgi:hypothetical protein
MKLTAKRLYLLLLGSIVLAIALLFVSVYFATGLLKNKSKVIADARVTVQALEQKQLKLAKARTDIEKYQSLSDIARSIVPQDKDQAQAIREIVTIAAANGIKLGSITFPSSSLGDAKVPYSQLKAVKTIPDVYSLDITIQSDTLAPAPFASLLSFLDALGHNRRTALVSGITLQPDAKTPDRLSFIITLSEYVKP